MPDLKVKIDYTLRPSSEAIDKARNALSAWEHLHKVAADTPARAHFEWCMLWCAVSVAESLALLVSNLQTVEDGDLEEDDAPN